MMKSRRILVIVNPHAGGGRAAAHIREIEERANRGAGHPADRIRTAVTDRAGHAADITHREALHFDVIVAAGGDGTVGEVVTGLLDSGAEDCILAVLPIGTGNDFARALGLVNMDMAIDALYEPHERTVDICDVEYTLPHGTGRRLSLVGSAAGYPAQVVRRTTERMKRYLGRYGYHYSTLACALSYRSPLMRVEMDGLVVSKPLLVCAAANTEWTAGGTIRMAPGARIDDGWIDVILVSGRHPLPLISSLRRLRTGSHIELPFVELRPAKTVRIESEDSVPLTVDGDWVGATPARLRVLPGALRVISGNPS